MTVTVPATIHTNGATLAITTGRALSRHSGCLQMGFSGGTGTSDTSNLQVEPKSESKQKDKVENYLAGKNQARRDESAGGAAGNSELAGVDTNR